MQEAMQQDSSVLAYGRGRSYGDSCLNPGGLLLDTSAMDCLIAFDREAGRLRAEAGITLGEILEVITPHGWFLPVVPGTQHVSLGGAIANDIHGKNHHVAGSFGNHVTALRLIRSDDTPRTLGPGDDLFAATIGGLGLTGLTEWAEVQLQRIPSSDLLVETLPFSGLDALLELSTESSSAWDYTVAWLDAVNRFPGGPRGVFSRANFAAGGQPSTPPRRPVGIPMGVAISPLNRLSVGLFNRWYLRRHGGRRRQRRSSYRDFFFPLDGLSNWNRLYGRRGFHQHQSVVPWNGARRTLEELLERVGRQGQGAWLAVAKGMGNQPPAGLLSFPRPGMTLALDIPHRGERTLALLADLDCIVLQAGGRTYPAKDGRMGAATFQAMYPRWREFQGLVDPLFSSSFWRRVTGNA